MASFPFPPESLNEWRPLDEAGRRSWLTYASQRFFDPGVVFVPSKARGRVIVVDGSLVDTLLGFYCAIGEAVNGPGGYFGLSMLAFDDCLFSGFGLEFFRGRQAPPKPDGLGFSCDRPVKKISAY